MICPKCKEGEIQEQTSIRGILLWKKKEITFFCPLCKFENKREFKLSKKDIQIEDEERANKPIERINKYESTKTINNV
jgi:hypothetical protein